jgi:hypothetical protein
MIKGRTDNGMIKVAAVALNLVNVAVEYQG